MSSRIPLAPGTVLGRYRIIGLAGEGGMGDIYKAFDGSLERTVALKRIRSGRADDAAQERFRREALALAQLNHPGICQVFEIAETVHGTFIAMEWVEGDTLADLLHPDPMPWRQAANLLRQVAEALAVAHAKGLVHRDLKPGNIMVTADGRAKVLDFGLVRFAGPEEEAPSTLIVPANLPEDAETAPGLMAASGSGSGRALTRIGSFMGTLGYTSPEQALARPVGPPSDIFSLGILAHEMVAGGRPFSGEGNAALDAVIDNQRAPFPRKLAPKAFRALVDRMLAPKSKARPAAGEVARTLHDLLSPMGVLAWSGLSAAAAALLILGGYSLFGRGVLAGLVKGRPARVAVMGFRNSTGVPLLTAQTELGLADLIASRLRTEERLQLLGADTVAQAARALKLDPPGASPEDQLRLAKALGADLVLSGEVDRHDGQDRLRYTLRDLRGRTRAQGEVEAKGVSGSTLAALPLAQATARDLKRAVDPLGSDARPDPYTISPEAFAAYAQGVEASRRGHYMEAEPLLAQAAYATPEWTSAATAYSFALSQLARPSADEALRWALVAARKEGNLDGESSVFDFLGILSNSRRDYPAARTYFEQGLRLADARGAVEDRAICLNGLGLAEEAQGRTDLAARRYAEALAATDQGKDLVMRGQVLTNLGNLALARGDLQEAAARYQSVVDTARQVGSESNEALGLNNLGIVLFSEFKTSEARAALERSLALREKNGEAYGVVSCLRNLGANALAEGKPQEARLWFQRSLDKAAAIPSVYGQGQAEFYLAGCDRMAGDFNRALKGYQTALTHSSSAHDRNKLGPELAGQAECLLRLNRKEEGQAALAKAAVLIPGNPCLLRAQAWSAFLQGDRVAAKELLELAIADPKHDAAEIRPELEGLRSRFSLR
ncbi:MAG TPA: protein kinase [Holophagaceae bacterium]|nr:protein kinase [Holophagaceae bacterium]